jgi:hypothetical protein
MNEEHKLQKSRVNFYLILDLMPGVSHNEILHAYNRAKNTYSNGSLASYTLLEDSTNSSIIEDIEKAFAILGNPSKRRAYDMEMGFNTWTEDKDSTVRGSHAQITSPSQKRSDISTEARSMASMPGFDMDDDIPPMPVKDPEPLPGRVIPIMPRSEVKTQGGVDFQPNHEFEKRIQEIATIDGAFLKAVRIYRCFSVDALAHRCKLSATHIRSIEEEDAAQLHQPVYLRGHLMLILQALEIPNPQALAKGYVDRVVQAGKLPKKSF